METDLSYWDMRRVVQQIVPRQSVLRPITDKPVIRTKQRKRWLKQYRLHPAGWSTFKERVLPDDKIDSALEVSIKAAGCPSPLNLDVWDGLVCPFNCLYCFANYFRATLYPNFFDRVPKGLRQANYDQLARQLDDLFRYRGQPTEGLSPVKKAVALNIPIRIGVRFEDFLPKEGRVKLTLRVLTFLAQRHYPVIVDTKSDLVGRDDYVRAFADNKAGAVVQISLSGSDEALFRKIEPGAPSPDRRFAALKRLNEAGVRAMPRIEPFLPFLADGEQETCDYAQKCKDAGVEWICWDAFSFSCANQFTRRLFQQRGLDFDRMFISASDSRLLTGLLLWRMMEHFRSWGYRCSTYDDMNSMYNDDLLCCNVKGAMPHYGINYASSKAAERYVCQQQGRPVGWLEYSLHVMKHGGFLSDGLRDELHHLWNNEGNPAYTFAWSAVEPAGRDRLGLLYRHTGHNPALKRALDWIHLEAEHLL